MIQKFKPLITGVLLLLILSSCKTSSFDCSKCPTVTIDSTFVLDTVVKLQSDTVTVTVQLDNFQKEEYRKVLDNDTTEVYAKWLEKWSNSKERVAFKIITKERFKKLAVPDTAKFMNEIRLLRAESNTANLRLTEANEELVKCMNKPKNNPLTTFYVIGGFIVGLCSGILLSKLAR